MHANPGPHWFPGANAPGRTPRLQTGLHHDALVIGHRQVTDAYLAQLARAQGGKLATFDQGLAKLHHDVAELVPISARAPRKP